MPTPKKERPASGPAKAKRAAGKTAARKTPAGAQGTVQGEGDYASAREFNKDEREFVESHDTEDLARRAAPEDAAAASDLEQAERKGKARAKPDPDADDASSARPDDADDDTELGRS